MDAMESRLWSLLARRSLQPLWESCYKVVVRGMGYNNYAPERNGEYQALAQVFGELDSDRPMVLDAGANEGAFVARVRALVPQAEVHAFEPNPPTYRRLAARFAGQEGVHTHAVGLSDREATLELADYADEDGSGHASFSPAGMATILPVKRGRPVTRALRATAVPVTTVDAVVAAHGIERIDYLKIDVEGHESEVLLGAQDTIAAGRVRNLQIEINAHNAVTGLSLYRMMSLLPGFEVYKILPDGLYRVHYRVMHDLFRYANFLFRRAA